MQFTYFKKYTGAEYLYIVVKILFYFSSLYFIIFYIGVEFNMKAEININKSSGTVDTFVVS